MKTIILLFLFTTILISFFITSKSYSQDKWTWSDSLNCKNVEGETLLIYFSNGQIMNAGRENYAYRVYNYYNVKLFIMWTAYFENSTNESYGVNIDSGSYQQFGISSPVKSIVITKYEQP